MKTKHPTTNIQQPERAMKTKHPTSNIQHPTSDARCRTGTKCAPTWMLSVIFVMTLLSACHKKAEVSGSTPETFASMSNNLPDAPAFASWGATKDEILAKLAKIKARITTNTGDVIVAEVGPDGLTSSDGKPVTHPLRTEYYFKDGKLTQSKTFP